MARFINDENFLGAAGVVTPKPYGNETQNLDALWDAWRDDMDNNPGPSKFIKDGYFKVGDIIRDTDQIVRIVDIVWQKGSIWSSYDIIQKYMVQPITKKGQWSKRWSWTYPGMIQRAYAQAGDPLALEGAEI